MRTYKIDQSLEKELSKLSKKDKDLFEFTLQKIQEIIECPNLNHYKNLRAPLQEFKRVHVKSSFVLLFRFESKENCIYFEKLKHHDKIYK